VPGENNSLVVEYVSQLKRLKTEGYFFMTESPGCKWSSSSTLRHLISKKITCSFFIIDAKVELQALSMFMTLPCLNI